jgi:hypothetical protein
MRQTAKQKDLRIIPAPIPWVNDRIGWGHYCPQPMGAIKKQRNPAIE